MSEQTVVNGQAAPPVAPPPQTAVIRQAIAEPEDYALVGLPSENSIRALKVFCKQLVGTPFLPKSLVKDQSEEQQAGTLLAVCLTGREMNLTPMQSLRSFWLSPDGRLGMYADAMMGIMLKAGAILTWDALTNEGAKLNTKRGHNTYVSEFSIEDAKRAGLWSKDKSIWPKYPRNMCRSRVIGDTFRTLFADLAGGGQMYTNDEIIDMEPDAGGAFTAREVAEQAADKRAEEDPGLRLQPKTAAATVVVEVKPEPVKQEMSPAEARNEAFLKDRAAEKPAPVAQASTEVDDFDLPRVNSTKEIVETDDARAKREFGERLSKIIAEIPGASNFMGSRFCLSFCGDEQGFDKWHAALDSLVEILRVDPEGKALAQFIAKPDELGKLTRKIVDGEPVKEKKPRKAKEEKPAEPVQEAAPETAPEPVEDPITKEFGWVGECLELAKSIKASRGMTMGSFASTMKSFGFDRFPPEDIVSGLLMYRAHPNAVLIIREGGKKGLSVSQVREVIEKHLGGSLATKEIAKGEFEAAMGAANREINAPREVKEL
jgi:hypothetical protein